MCRWGNVSIWLLVVGCLSRPKLSLHIFINNPNTSLHKKVNPK